MKVTVVVPAAGKGIRFGGTVKKPFAKLKRRPILSYVLKALQTSPLIKDIVLVVDGSLLKKAGRVVKRSGIKKIKYIVSGGRTRYESVRNGLRCVDKNTSLVMIHDGVRPFINKEMIRNTIMAALRFDASSLAVPVQSTIKVSHDGSFVKYTLERRELWEAQTPQVFKKELIENAYKKVKRGRLFTFTDDAALVEVIGVKVKLVRGDYNNIKITTKEDIKIAEALLRSRE